MDFNNKEKEVQDKKSSPEDRYTRIKRWYDFL